MNLILAENRSILIPRISHHISQVPAPKGHDDVICGDHETLAVVLWVPLGTNQPHFQVQPACRHLVALSTFDGHSRPLPTLLPTRAHRVREQFKISTIVYLIIQADVERSIGLFEVTARG